MEEDLFEAAFHGLDAASVYACNDKKLHHGDGVFFMVWENGTMQFITGESTIVTPLPLQGRECQHQGFERLNLNPEGSPGVAIRAGLRAAFLSSASMQA